MKVFLSGEGPDDLGDWFHPAQYRSHPPVAGILEALLRRVATVDFSIVGAQAWKRIRKFRTNSRMRAETQNVLGLMLEADETGADVLVFVRDQDGYADRQADVEEGIRLARRGEYDAAVVGGVAVQEIEAWILAMLGERRSERHADPKAVLGANHGITDRPGKVRVVEDADMTRIPDDAASLLAWLNEAKTAFGAQPPMAPGVRLY